MKTAIESRAFGATGLKVSLLGYGSASIWGDAGGKSKRVDEQIEDADIGHLLNGLLDAGVTLMDTAGMYGLAERRIGRHIAHRRSEYVISSKCGYDNNMNVDWSPASLTAGIERSLRDLKTDVIDIMHLHSCALSVLQDGAAIEALEKARTAGKVRHLAYSGDNEALEWAIDSGRFASVETSVNICDQRVLDSALGRAAQRNLGVIVKRPIANAWWQFSEKPVGKYCLPYWERGKAMGLDPAQFGGLSWNELFLRFSAFQPGVSSCIVGTTKLAHVEENIAALAKGPLPAEAVSRLRTLFRTHDSGWKGQQ